MSFSNRLMEACEAKTIADLARKLQVPHPTARNYVKEGRLPAADILLRIKEETNVSLDWLLTGEGPKFIAEDAFSGLPAHLRNEVKKVAKVSQTSFQDAIQELLSRQLAAMNGDYDLGEIRKIPVYEMKTDEELFGAMDALIDKLPPELRQQTLSRMIGELVVKAATDQKE